MINRVYIGATDVINQQRKDVDTGGFVPTYEILHNYDHLFTFLPDSQHDYIGGLGQTLDLIKKVIGKYSYQVKNLASHLKASTLEQSSFNIWHFCINNIMYKEDKFGYEEIRTPGTTWKHRGDGVDCDDFCILTACLLIQMGYRPQLVVVGFNGLDYGHIYTAVNASLAQPPYDRNNYDGGAVRGGVVVDPVMKTIFNKHPKGITKALIMNTHTVVTGLGRLSGSVNVVIQEISTYRDTFAANGTMNDIALNFTPESRPAQGTILPGHILYIDPTQEHPEVKLPIPSSTFYLYGPHIIERVGIVDGKVGGVWLTTGKTTTTYYKNPRYKGVKAAVITDTTDIRKTISGWKKDAATADKYMNEAAGKIENCRRIYNFIKKDVAPDITLIKETQRVQDFKNIVADLEAWKVYAEAAYQQCYGLKNTANPFFRDQKALQNISDVYKMAAERMLAAETDFLKKENDIKDWMKITSFEKLQQAVKTATYAPIRGIVEAVIRINAFGLATALKLAQERKPKDYENYRSAWKDYGGDRTNFDNAVNAGAVKKPLLKGGSIGETEQNYVKLPVGVGTTAATAIVTATGGTAAPYVAPAGVVIDGLVVAINAAKIPLKDKEPNPSDPAAETFDFDFKNIPPDEPSSSGSSTLLLGAGGLAIVIAIIAGSGKSK